MAIKYPKGIRFGVKVGGLFKNVGIIVKNPVSDKAGDALIDGIRNLKDTMTALGRGDIAELLVAEARD